MQQKTVLGRLFSLGLLAMVLVLASGCQRVTVRGDRLNGDHPVKLTKVYIYSFLNANPGMQLSRYTGEVSEFQGKLEKAFQSNGVPAKVVDAVQQAGLNGVSAVAPGSESHQKIGGMYIRSGVAYLPIKEMLVANKSDEAAFGASHRLILVLAMISGGTNYTADMSWRMEDSSNDQAVAQGTLHFVMDIRGIPSEKLIGGLMDELTRLNIN